jgi:hypothetical protein
LQKISASVTVAKEGGRRQLVRKPPAVMACSMLPIGVRYRLMSDGIMGRPLRVLLIEDSNDDACLLLRELEHAGYEPTWERVETAADLGAALRRREWDIITCDYVMPNFGALAALELLTNRAVRYRSSS